MWRPSVAQFLKCFSHSFEEQRKSKSPTDVLAKHKAQIPAKEGSKDRPEFKAKPKDEEGARGDKPGKGGAKDYKKTLV
jgi:hypothetical protein